MRQPSSSIASMTARTRGCRSTWRCSQSAKKYRASRKPIIALSVVLGRMIGMVASPNIAPLARQRNVRGMKTSPLTRKTSASAAAETGCSSPQPCSQCTRVSAMPGSLARPAWCSVAQMIRCHAACSTSPRLRGEVGARFARRVRGRCLQVDLSPRAGRGGSQPCGRAATPRTSARSPRVPPR